VALVQPGVARSGVLRELLKMKVIPQAPRVNRVASEALSLPCERSPDVWLHVNHFTHPLLRASIAVLYLVRLHGARVTDRIKVIPSPVSFDRLSGPGAVTSRGADRSAVPSRSRRSLPARETWQHSSRSARSTRQEDRRGLWYLGCSRAGI
jgi:hypothetical protein